MRGLPIRLSGLGRYRHSPAVWAVAAVALMVLAAQAHLLVWPLTTVLSLSHAPLMDVLARERPFSDRFSLERFIPMHPPAPNRHYGNDIVKKRPNEHSPELEIGRPLRALMRPLTAVPTTAPTAVKLRRFYQPDHAEWLAFLAPHMQGILPPLIARDRNWVMMEMVPDATQLELPLSPAQCRTIGQMFGLVHASWNRTLEHAPPSTVLPSNPLKHLPQAAANLAGPCGGAHIDVQSLATNFLRVLPPCPLVGVELTDINLQNFMFSAGAPNRLFYIDEEGIRLDLKGVGIGKPLLDDWFDTPEKMKAFWDGYRQHTDNGWFTPQYRAFVILVQALRRAKAHKCSPVMLAHMQQQLRVAAASYTLSTPPACPNGTAAALFALDTATRHAVTALIGAGQAAPAVP